MNQPHCSKRYDRQRGRRRKSSYNGYKETDNIRAVIADSGAHTIKIGWSDDAFPRVVPNCIMKVKSERKRLFIADQIAECRDCSGLYYLLPCEKGYITKWDVQKPIWDHVFLKNVCPISNEDPVIITQPLFNFKSIQDCMDELFFEEYDCNELFRVLPADLAYLKYTQENAIPNGNCIVVDSGYSYTHIVPYIDGGKYLNGIKRLNVGGKLLTNHLKDLISYRQYNVMEETYVINQVKEDTCYVAMDVKDELKIAQKSGPDNNIVKNYVLPDFNNIRRGYVQDPANVDERAENCQILRLNNERFVVPEILFHPSDIGMKSMGIAEAIVRSINLCPAEHRCSLTQHIILVGGNFKFPGIKDRLYKDLRSRLSVDWQLNLFLPQDPITYSWQGGKNLLNFPNFKSMLITKSEYFELGSHVIQKRFNKWMVHREKDNDLRIELEPEDKEIAAVSYLANIKGRSIFGKESPTKSNEDEQNDVKVDEDGSSSSQSPDDQDSTTDDSSSNNTISKNEEKKRLIVNHERKDETNEIRLHFEQLEEEDLAEIAELFPLGKSTYL